MNSILKLHRTEVGKSQAILIKSDDTRQNDLTPRESREESSSLVAASQSSISLDVSEERVAIAKGKPKYIPGTIMQSCFLGSSSSSPTQQ